MDLPVVEALFDGSLDQPVLIDPGEAFELGGGDDREQVLAAAVFVGDLDLGAGQRRLDHRFQFRQIDHERDCMGPACWP